MASARQKVRSDPDGSRSLIDALHHAAHRGRTVGLDAAREQLATTKADHFPRSPAALTALVLEVRPIEPVRSVMKEVGPVAEAASDFDVLGASSGNWRTRIV